MSLLQARKADRHECTQATLEKKFQIDSDFAQIQNFVCLFKETKKFVNECPIILGYKCLVYFGGLAAGT